MRFEDIDPDTLSIEDVIDVLDGESAIRPSIRSRYTGRVRDYVRSRTAPDPAERLIAAIAIGSGSGCYARSARSRIGVRGFAW